LPIDDVVDAFCSVVEESCDPREGWLELACELALYRDAVVRLGLSEIIRPSVGVLDRALHIAASIQDGKRRGCLKDGTRLGEEVKPFRLLTERIFRSFSALVDSVKGPTRLFTNPRPALPVNQQGVSDMTMNIYDLNSAAPQSETAERHEAQPKSNMPTNNKPIRIPEPWEFTLNDENLFAASTESPT